MEVDTPVSFDEVLKRLRKMTGNATVAELATLARDVGNEAESLRQVKKRFSSQSGFISFELIDYDACISISSTRRRSAVWIICNPLTAIAMLQHDLSAGVFARVQLLLTEKEEGLGATVVCVRPSSMIPIEDGNAALLAAAKALDNKVDALIARATEA